VFQYVTPLNKVVVH